MEKQMRRFHFLAHIKQRNHRKPFTRITLWKFARKKFCLGLFGVKRVLITIAHEHHMDSHFKRRNEHMNTFVASLIHHIFGKYVKTINKYEHAIFVTTLSNFIRNTVNNFDAELRMATCTFYTIATLMWYKSNRLVRL